MEEKCFCHLNGYKVKDSDARKMIEALEQATNEKIAGLEETTNNLNEEVTNTLTAKLEDVETSTTEKISEMETSTTKKISEMETSTTEKISEMETSFNTKFKTFSDTTNEALEDLEKATQDSLDSMTFMYHINQDQNLNVYLDKTNGLDTNSGLSVTEPVNTFEKAMRVGFDNGNEFRIKILDDSTYYLHGSTLNCFGLHIEGVNGRPKLIIDTGMALYNNHLNFKNLEIETASTGNFYTDNSYVIFQQCVLNCDFIMNGGHIETTETTFSSLRLNTTFARLVHTTIQDKKLSNRNASISASSSEIFITSSFNVNFTEEQIYPIFNLNMCKLHMNCKVTNNGVVNTIENVINNSIVISTKDRALTMKPFSLTNGSFILTPHGNIKNSLPWSKTINQIILPAFMNNEDTFQFSFYESEFYNYKLSDVKLNTLNVFKDGVNYNILNNHTVTEFNKSGANVKVTINSSDITFPQYTDFVCYLSITCTFNEYV